MHKFKKECVLFKESGLQKAEILKFTSVVTYFDAEIKNIDLDNAKYIYLANKTAISQLVTW